MTSKFSQSILSAIITLVVLLLLDKLWTNKGKHSLPPVLTSSDTSLKSQLLIRKPAKINRHNLLPHSSLDNVMLDTKLESAHVDLADSLLQERINADIEEYKEVDKPISPIKASSPQIAIISRAEYININSSFVQGVNPVNANSSRFDFPAILRTGTGFTCDASVAEQYNSDQDSSSPSSSSKSKLQWCRDMMSTYHVVIGRSWGGLMGDSRKEWDLNSCNDLIKIGDDENDENDVDDVDIDDDHVFIIVTMTLIM